MLLENKRKAKPNTSERDNSYGDRRATPNLQVVNNLDLSLANKVTQLIILPNVFFPCSRILLFIIVGLIFKIAAKVRLESRLPTTSFCSFSLSMLELAMQERG